MRKAPKRKFTLVANWKMNPDSVDEAKTLVASFNKALRKANRVTGIVCPPAPFIPFLIKKGKKSSSTVLVGAQDIDARPKGAFTGSVSASQMRSAGAEYVIIGHSERRSAGDTDAVVTEKVRRALESGLKVILCVGEDSRDHNAQYLLSVRAQLTAALSKIEKSDFKRIIIAYEPVWAIGKSFETAPSPRDIHEMSIFIKKTIAEIAGTTIGLKMMVLYGGSVNSDNSAAMLADGGIDGLLVGRQSLDTEAFSRIIDYANNI